MLSSAAQYSVSRMEFRTEECYSTISCCRPGYIRETRSGLSCVLSDDDELEDVFPEEETPFEFQHDIAKSTQWFFSRECNSNFLRKASELFRVKAEGAQVIEDGKRKLATSATLGIRKDILGIPSGSVTQVNAHVFSDVTELNPGIQSSHKELEHLGLYYPLQYAETTSKKTELIIPNSVEVEQSAKKLQKQRRIVEEEKSLTDKVLTAVELEANNLKEVDPKQLGSEELWRVLQSCDPEWRDFIWKYRTVEPFPECPSENFNHNEYPQEHHKKMAIDTELPARTYSRKIPQNQHDVEQKYKQDSQVEDSLQSKPLYSLHLPSQCRREAASLTPNTPFAKSQHTASGEDRWTVHHIESNLRFNRMVTPMLWR